MRDIFTVRTPKTLGCTLVSTALVQSLRETFKNRRIDIYTGFPDLLIGLKEADRIIDLENEALPKYDIDLYEYLNDRKPQENIPLRHLVDHTFEAAEEQLKGILRRRLDRRFRIKINLATDEISRARSIVKNLSHGKKLVWLQTKSRNAIKDWKDGCWEELINNGKGRFSFVDLSTETYARRVSIAITKHCHAGITLDTFLLHGSEAVGAKNVITLLTSSHREVVAYPDQTVIEQSRMGATITASMVLDKLFSFG